MTRRHAAQGGLGRGLASLIPTGPAEDQEPATMGTQRMGAAAADVVDRHRPRRGRCLPAAAGLAPSDAVSQTSVRSTARSSRPQIEPNPRQPRRCSTRRHSPNSCTRSASSG